MTNRTGLEKELAELEKDFLNYLNAKHSISKQKYIEVNHEGIIFKLRCVNVLNEIEINLSRLRGKILNIKAKINRTYL